jgi:hypothetical protein
MSAISSIRFCAPAPGESPGRCALRIIEEIGSLEFALGLSRGAASEILLREIRLLTNGLLVLNALFFEGGHIRVPHPAEGELLEKKWGVPLKWLKPARAERMGALTPSGLYPPTHLEAILVDNRISVFLTADEGILREGEVVFAPPSVSQARPERVVDGSGNPIHPGQLGHIFPA